MKKWIVAVVIGVGMLLLSTGAGGNDDNLVRCGNEIMSPGDECEETSRYGTTKTETYEEMKASREAGRRTFETWGRWALLGGGLVLTIGGVIGIVRTRRRRAAMAAQAQPVPNMQFPPQPNAQFPPQYSVPPQQHMPQYPMPHQQNVPQQRQGQPYPPFGPRG